MRTPTRALAAISCAAALVLPSGALADESSLGGYGEVGGVSQTEISGGGPTAATPTATAVPHSEGGGGNLPFTGFDVLAVAAVGGLLAGAGFTLRRLSDRGPSEPS